MATLTSAWYKFENDYTDGGSEGNGLTLTALGSGNSFTTGKVGSYCLDGNGSGAARRTTATGIASGDVSISMSAWIMLDALPSGAYWTLFGLGSVGVVRGQIRVWYADVGGTKELTVSAGDKNLQYFTTLSTGTWYHVACTYTSGTKAIVLYLNGSQVASGTATTAANLTYDTNGAVEALCDGQAGPVGTTNGRIDDFRIYEAVLTAAEVTELYNGGAGTSSELGASSATNALLFGGGL